MAEELKIGINTLFLIPGEVGGSETYLCETIKGILAHHPDVRLTLFTHQENDSFLRALVGGPSSRVEFRLLPFRASNRYARIIREQTELPLAVRRSGVDVLWSPGYTAPALLRLPQAVSILDMQYRSHPEDFSMLARLTTDALIKAAAQRCQCFLAISEFSGHEVQRYLRVPPALIHVTPLAAAGCFHPQPAPDEQARRNRMAPFAAPYILAVANSYPHKNLHELVRAFGRLEESIPHNLVLVGRARLGEPLLEAAAAALKQPGRIHRLSGLEPGDLAALYRGADLFCSPSVYEGFGLPILEALASGTPVAVVRQAAVEELCGKCASYAQSGGADDICKATQAALAWSPAERAAVVARGLERAGRFSWCQTARLTIEALRALAARR